MFSYAKDSLQCLGASGFPDSQKQLVGSLWYLRVMFLLGVFMCNWGLNECVRIRSVFLFLKLHKGG